MFETLSQGFRNARQRLSGLTELTEDNIDAALSDVRLSLLEADVEQGVTRRFLEDVKAKAVGKVVQTKLRHRNKTLKVGPSERFIQICQEELERLMAADGPAIVFAKPPQLTHILMVGLQGSGKTTTTAKLARLLEKERQRKPLLVAADVQRPGAIEQLQILGERLNIPVFAIPGGQPADICERAVAHARKMKRDTVIFDTAGRLAIDAALMEELGDIRRRVQPQNILMVVDAMIGQDAVQTATAFHQQLGLTGVVLSKLDGDARGGAALSIKQATGAPIRFVGMGEALDKLETFRPDGMASRILGFGDVVGLMKDFEGVVDERKAEEDAKRMLQGQFTLDDFLEQIGALKQMGPLQDVMEKLPFFGDAAASGMRVDDRELVRTQAMVSSMTRQERREIEVFQKQPGRLQRVAKGSGRTPKEVADLLQRFAFMRQLLGNIGDQAGMLNKIPGMKQLAMARRLKDAVKTGGLEANPMLAGLAESLLEAAVADGGEMRSGSAALRRPALDRNKRKALRQQQKKARRKSRGN